MRIIASVLVVLIIVAAVFFFRSRRSTNSQPNTAIIHRAPQFGIFNLKGDAADPLIAEDTTALEPVFGHALQSTNVVPQCDVLFIYCDLDLNGRVLNFQDGLREIIRDSGAVIVAVASVNPGEAYVAYGRESRDKNYGNANLVMTTNRNGPHFASFFARLFADMKTRGVTMPVAFVKLAPQIPGGGDDPDVPGIIFSSEGGQVVFK
jgi:hypothetical protein